jgi:hypothetical protein
MAGAGFKDFVAGEVLTASDVDTYLMQQTIMVFADASARTTALSAVLAEGMMAYLQDLNTVQVYDGTEWVEVAGSSNVASDCIQPNFNTISEDYTFESGYNGVSAGPITIADGFTVTVPAGSAWSIV